MHRYMQLTIITIVRTQLNFNGVDLDLDLDLGSQLICIAGLEFPTMGGPVLGDPGTLS